MSFRDKSPNGLETVLIIFKVLANNFSPAITISITYPWQNYFSFAKDKITRNICYYSQDLLSHQCLKYTRINAKSFVDK